MKYRLLTTEEWSRLEGIIPNEYIPSPDMSAVAIAEDDNGEIKAALPCQLQWHLDGMVILSPHVNFISLKKVIDDQLKKFPGIQYYAFPTSDKVARMAEIAGMKLMPCLVFKGEPT